jgi:hypothetical protein
LHCFEVTPGSGFWTEADLSFPIPARSRHTLPRWPFGGNQWVGDSLPIDFVGGFSEVGIGACEASSKIGTSRVMPDHTCAR